MAAYRLKCIGQLRGHPVSKHTGDGKVWENGVPITMRNTISWYTVLGLVRVSMMLDQGPVLA